MNGEKHITSIGFVEYRKKSDAGANLKVYYDQFLENKFQERYCNISQSYTTIVYSLSIWYVAKKF